MVNYTEALARPATPTTIPGQRSRLAYSILAWIFVGCVVIQVFLAGLAIFASPAYWAWHSQFVSIFHYLPLLMVVLAFSGRLAWRERILTVALFTLLLLQHPILILGQTFGVPAVSALHTANALAIFGLSLRMAVTPKVEHSV